MIKIPLGANMTVGEMLAIAVLKGDEVAALALADRVKEEYSDPREDHMVKDSTRTSLGYEVYRWPEFRAFARRLGIKYGLKTKSITITLAPDEVVNIQQTYNGSDHGEEI